MPDAPASFTTRYSLAKWSENSYPGATNLNNNWDLIDQYIYSASLASALTYSLPLRRSGNVVSIGLDSDALVTEYNVLTIKLFNNPYNLTIRGTGDGGLDTIQDITTTSSPRFANVYASNDITASNDIIAGNYLSSDLLSVITQGTIGSLIVQGSSYFNTYANILSNGNSKFGNVTSSMSITGSITHTGSLIQTGNSQMYNGYTSGWAGSGWKLDQNVSQPGSTLEIDSIFCRASLSVYELIMNTIKSQNGFFFITSTARVADTADGAAGDIEIIFEDPEGNSVCPFADNDILLSQTIDLDSTTVVARTVVSVEEVNGNSIQANFIFGSSVITGSVFARIGNSTNVDRRASIYMASDDNQAPFIDVIDGVTSYTDWTNGSKLKIRIGKLTGVANTSFGTLTGYGMYAGGGVYLESSASENSIALMVDSGSAQLTMKQTGNTIFDFNTSTSTAKIAGWSFNKEKIWSTGVLPAFGNLELYASGTESYIYTGYGQSGIGDQDKGVLLGKIPQIFGENIGEIGFIAYDYTGISPKKYVVLTDTTQSISDWNITENKLYKGDAGSALVLSTLANPYITGSGFEVYNPINPKLFIGKKGGYGLDWNITTPNVLTISGSIVGSEITAGTITAAWIRTAATGQRLEINSGSLNNIKWVTSTGKTFYMTPEDQGSIPGLTLGSSYMFFSSSTTGQSANIDYATMAMYSASRSTIVRAEYTSYTGGGKNFISYYTASSLVLTTGTLNAGNIASASIMDGTYLVIQEAIGVPGQNYTMKFNILNAAQAPHAVVLKGRYEGSPSHEVAVQVWNQATSAWVEVGNMFNATLAGHDDEYYFPLTQASNYVSASVVQIRFYHADSGITAHHSYIDYVGLQYHPYIRVDSNATM